MPNSPPNARPTTVPRRRDFINLGFDPLSRSGIVDAILGADAGARFRYVVTPNVDHMVRIDADPEVAALYRDAWLCLNDSRILSALARLARIDLPATPGSDLVVDLLNDPRLARDTPILVVGGEPGLARPHRRANAIERTSHVDIDHENAKRLAVASDDRRTDAICWPVHLLNHTVEAPQIERRNESLHGI